MLLERVGLRRPRPERRSDAKPVALAEEQQA
jgi:hypothetical protein